MISSEELEKIQQLRCNLPPDLLTTIQLKDDHFLIRWLRARNMDVEKATEMLKKSIKWRLDNNVNAILKNDEDIPLNYRRMYPTAVIGRDANDCLVTLIPLGRMNQRTVIENEGMETALRYNIIWMEKIMKRLKEIEEALRKKGLRLVQIVDMEYYSSAQLVHGPTREYILKTHKIYDENYPEILKSVLVINAPKVFTLLFSMIKPFLSKETIGKVSIYGHDEETWKRVIQERFAIDKIPKRWYGSREGTDEFCSQDKEVWPNGPIPLKFFSNKTELDNLVVGDFKIATIPASDYFQVDIPFNMTDYVTTSSIEIRPELCWKFKVDSHDIEFSVKFFPCSKLTTCQDPILISGERRIEAKQGMQQGSHTCRCSGTYVILFDNRHNSTRSKTVHYSVHVTHDRASLLPTDDNAKK